MGIKGYTVLVDRPAAGQQESSGMVKVTETIQEAAAGHAVFS